MGRVTGIGGIFFKSEKPGEMAKWYEKHLKIVPASDGSGVTFEWLDPKTKETGMTVWSIFPRDTKYFGAGGAGFMVNYRVDNLEELLTELEQSGVAVERGETQEYGSFAWVTDPEGNRIELWQAPKE
jgi:catechol 2,3-dioxygenase-like lactoylglutathione lyase family enzyme